MKTKIIPFDAEMAKDIQDGKIKGKIKTRNGQDVRILLWNNKNEEGYVIIALVDKPGTDLVATYTCNGKLSKWFESGDDLVLEVPVNMPQFKPFDKVLCRDNDDDVWKANLFSHEACTLSYPYYVCGGSFYKQCIPFEGNEGLVGTTNKPKGE